jgi:hypothetical protein
MNPKPKTINTDPYTQTLNRKLQARRQCLALTEIASTPNPKHY